ncbi:hypothetical protein DdX_15911 [Ditylenchus destructor]|uniref:Uncharacterized protein n=1 Tax=Ditylenchus destructor TaxID=166010 RepID=A0AAD4QX98_9BILA|nr:hypothetical protein DdX_15911 [Ditylenchus destructor]
MDHCACGQWVEFNSAHKLSNWMIAAMGLTGVIFRTIGENDEKMASCCRAGRPIRAKEMASVNVNPGVFEKIGLRKHMNPPDGDCFIYCNYHGLPGEGHVYYGTRTNCVIGRGSGEDLNMSYYEYYY